MAVKINIKPGGWTAIGLVGILLCGGSLMVLQKKHPEWFKHEAGVASAIPEGTKKLGGTVSGVETTMVTKPVYSIAQVRAENAGQLRLQGIGWNAQMGAIYANGGVNTARGSLMDQNGVSLNYLRQDNYPVLAAELYTTAKAFKDGNPDPAVGSHFVILMGDGSPLFLYGLQKQLDTLNLHASIIGATGFSRGEDKCMGPPEWKKDPQKAKGGVISAVIMDGDWNLCVSWAEVNHIKINPDYTTYDKNALNFFKVDDVNAANNAFINGDCEERPYAAGSGIGKKKICVQGVATWTPGDVAVLEMKGGVVSLLSTRENASQMAATIIGIDEWMMANPATTTNFLQAALNGGVAVQTDRAKLRAASNLSALVWKEHDGPWWNRYYNGVEQQDPETGENVRLGGSLAIGLASNLQYFLPGENGTKSGFQSVFDTFCRVNIQFYPKDMSYCPKNPVNTFFLEKLAEAAGPTIGRGSVFSQFTGTENQVVGNADYSDITFEVGSAVIRPESVPTLQKILDQLTIGSNLGVIIEGYTSSDGDSDANQRLSEARAAAVKAWLVAHASRRDLFSTGRIQQPVGYGESKLVFDSSGREDPRASRRVAVKMVSSN